jgi:hypothetical protein
MCYSAGASFIGGAVISAIGVATVKEARKPSQVAFASIPLLFGLQQITEGFLWLALTDPAFAHLERAGTYGFLLMARIVWPTMLPLSVLLMEEGGAKRRLQFLLLGMGAAVSLYYTYCLLFLNVVPDIEGHHIRYISDFPESLAVPVFVVYFIAVITPLFISKNTRTRLLGVLMFLACAVTAVLFFQYLTSVWCFFAAIISVVVYWIIKEPGTVPEAVLTPGE